MLTAMLVSDPRHFVFLYGTTPPRLNSSDEEVEAAAFKLHERIKSLPLDGLVVYDVQDESSRTHIPRPFPFLPTLDSRIYSKRLRNLTQKPVIAYKCVSGSSEQNFQEWLNETAYGYDLDHLSLVGAPTSRNTTVQLPLSKATQLAAAHPRRFTLGGVCIAERHSSQKSESRRILQKSNDGCQFFISQAVYSPTTTIQMLRDYWLDCQRFELKPSRIVLTFTPCGRSKTLEFLQWLGIQIPKPTQQAILTASDPLEKSIQICRDTLLEILDQDCCANIPLGINVESVSIKKTEIDGSIELFHTLNKVLPQRG